MEETEVSINPYSCNASVFVSPQQRFGGRMNGKPCSGTCMLRAGIFAPSTHL